jgi:hypothetical protein
MGEYVAITTDACGEPKLLVTFHAKGGVGIERGEDFVKFSQSEFAAIVKAVAEQREAGIAERVAQLEQDVEDLRVTRVPGA